MAEPTASTGGSASAFRQAVSGGGLGSVAAPVANVHVAPVANDNASPARQQRAAPVVAPGDDPSVAEQLLTDDDEGIDGLGEAAEAAEPDEDAPAVDPLEEVFHTNEKGEVLKMRDLVESLKKGVVPEALHDQVKFEMTVNGTRMVLSAKELGGGYMRHADYTKKTQAVQEQRKENEAFSSAFDASCERAAKDPTGQELRKLMRKMGLGEAAERMAASIANEYYQMESMTEGERKAHLRARAAEEALETAREREAMNSESARDKKRRAQQQAFQREYDNLKPTAMQRAQLKGTASEVAAYNHALRVLLNEPGATLTLDLCTQAAMAARDELADQATRYRAETQAPSSPAAAQVAAQAQQRQQQQGLSPRRAAPAPVAGGMANSQTGGTPGAFRKYLASRGGR
jgi:hypothetical protein